VHGLHVDALEAFDVVGDVDDRQAQHLLRWDIYTIAHHVYTEDGTRKMMVAWLRYVDTFTKVEQTWYISERQIILNWSETRPLGPPTGG
jgi:hypothetical protein